jgi:hypothetical protein
METALTFCIVCGGDHQPHPLMCDDAGMERQIKKLGARRWNQITGHINRTIFDRPEPKK